MPTQVCLRKFGLIVSGSSPVVLIQKTNSGPRGSPFWHLLSHNLRILAYFNLFVKDFLGHAKIKPMKGIIFESEYRKLNKAQKEAVDTIEGPVMVIAGPGTGKTQVLALRIANILTETDTTADGILCLTFTNSGVRAMRERLTRLIGPAATRVTISTFHSFSAALIEEFYEHLGLMAPPALLDEREAVLLADRLLEEGEWEYLRTRGGGAHNFRDLRSLISFLKRENISPQEFLTQVEEEIEHVKKDPENISSKGKTKGSLKSTALGKLERLERTLEVARFYDEYEEAKLKENLADYDDILKLAVNLMEHSEEARASVAERYLYILVDEHQDSSGVQNSFLELVWGKVEKPNLFVVGDDRQLIYGFGGASISHFESFGGNFPGTKLITLTENYRSTQSVLDAAEKLLRSRLAQGKLKSQTGESHPLKLVEAQFPRDEILAAGLAIKEKLSQGLNPEDCAVLVPKNHQVRSAVSVLKDLGLPVAAQGKTSFFNLRESQALLAALRALNNPLNPVFVSTLILEPALRLPIIEVQRLIQKEGRKLDLEKLSREKGAIGEVGKKLSVLVDLAQEKGVYELIQTLGKELFFERAEEHAALLRQIEAVRTLVHLALSRMEKRAGLSLNDFVEFIERLEEYGEDLPVAVFAGSQGVRVMTLHTSKGLEFDFVWVAHLDEKSLMKGKNAGFTLPEKLSSFAAQKDEEAARRELYVAITRAKRFSTLSYSLESYTGGELSLAKIVAELPEEMFEKKNLLETEKEIRAKDPLLYVASVEKENPENGLEAVKDWVRSDYVSTPLSVTHLNNFLTCPWRWYFRNFLRLPEPESEALLFGNLAHALVEKSIVERRVSETYEAELNKLKIFDERLRKRFAKDAEKLLKRFGKVSLPFISEESRTEVRLRSLDAKTGLEVTGSIDLLENLEAGVRVTDFKTGRAKKSDDYLRQLAMYSYLLENQRKPLKVISSRLAFLEAEEKDYFFETQIGREEIQKLKEEISEYNQALKDRSWSERPCEFKPSQFERECEYCALRKRLF